jgi:hypothetical protein
VLDFQLFAGGNSDVVSAMNWWICISLCQLCVGWNSVVLSALNQWIYGLSAVCMRYAVALSDMRGWTGDILSATYVWTGVGLSATYVRVG